MIEAVSVCVDYSDHLDVTCDNINVLDRWMVVTHPSDINTIDICKTTKIEHVETSVMYDNGAHFAKGRAINAGLRLLNCTDWLLHIDADILLPKDFLDIIERAELDPSCIYGARRAFNNTVRTEINPRTNQLHARPLIGFFQLWHSSMYKDYPQQSTHAGDDDQEMSLRYEWPCKWKYLDMVVEDVSGEFCTNWYGRKMHRRISLLD